MSLAPLDLISAHPWRRTTFTTYALSLSFFEAILLDALVRGGGREVIILTDVHGIRTALSEQGARRVGRDYEVEPLAVVDGVFHPKISVLTSEDECHLLVGSGNLTFSGWGGNFELFEHLHPSFAADAIEDAARFFQLLSTSDRIRHGARERCAEIAGDLHAAVLDQARNGEIRLFHSLDGAISQQVAQTVEDLGGAVRLVAAAPFWDGGSAIDRLCKAIGLDHVFVHVHPGGSVEGTVGSNWPARAASTVHAVRLEVMEEAKPRRLHAKAFEVMCRRGRLLLSGSANATTAALDSAQNIEVCVARIQRERMVGWTFTKSKPPELRVIPDDELDTNGDVAGVLRAVLEDEQITGQVLAPRMSGVASVFQLTTEGPELLDKTSVATNGTFQVRAPGLEMQSWKGGRLVLRVQSANGQLAEGFVSVAAFAEITRRTGALGPKLLAVLAGTETPADVAAIMSWFHEDPRRLARAMSKTSSGGSIDKDDGVESSRTVAVAELDSHHTVHRPVGITQDIGGGASWARFIDHVFAAFRERRGPFGRTSSGRRGEDDDDEEVNRPTPATSVDPTIERSLAVFQRLFSLLLSPENAPQHAMSAFDLTQYVCERLQPDFAKAKDWLQRLVEILTAVGPPPDRRSDVAAAILTLLGAKSEPAGDRAARARLLRLGFEISGESPSPEPTRGFQSVLIQTAEFAELWARLQKVRTFPEQVRAYLTALKAGQPSTDYADLALAAPDEWPVLEDAFRSERARKRILVLDHWMEACPRCNRVLPRTEAGKLRARSIATARDCCGRILLYPGA